MKKIDKIGIGILLSFACHFVHGQSVPSYYNSLKSAVKAEEKERLLIKMEDAAQKEPVNGLLLDASKQMVALAFAEEENYKKAMLYATTIKDSGMLAGTKTGLGESLLNKGRLDEARDILVSELDGVEIENGTAKLTKSQTFPALLYGDLLYREKRYKEALPYLAVAMNANWKLPRYKELYAMNLVCAEGKDDPMPVVESIILFEGRRSNSF